MGRGGHERGEAVAEASGQPSAESPKGRQGGDNSRPRAEMPSTSETAYAVAANTNLFEGV